MRNFKKVLSLVLCMAMMLSVMVVGAGATFSDADKVENGTAVDFCSALGIINGYEDGSFRPEGTITRAEMTKMMAIAMNGKEPPVVDNGKSSFVDVLTSANSKWANKYIEFCYAAKVVAGIGANKYNPDGNVTATEAAKMLLVILGNDPVANGYLGSGWDFNVNVDAAKAGLFKGIEDIDLSAALTRDDAAQMIWNALNAKLVGDEDNTLLADKFGAKTAEGIMTKIDYNQDTGVYTYWLGKMKDEHDHYKFDGDKYYRTTADYTDLFAQKIEILAKGEKALSIRPVYENAVVVSDVWGNVSAIDNTHFNTVKISGQKYRLDNVAKDWPGIFDESNMVAYNDYANNFFTGLNWEPAFQNIDRDGEPVFNAEGDPRVSLAYYTGAEDNSGKPIIEEYEQYSFVGIDQDGGGDIDIFVVYPYAVLKTENVNKDSFVAREIVNRDASMTVYEWEQDRYMICGLLHDGFNGSYDFKTLENWYKAGWFNGSMKAEIEFDDIQTVGTIEAYDYVKVTPGVFTAECIDIYEDLDLKSATANSLSGRDLTVTLGNDTFDGNLLEQLDAFRQIALKKTYSYIEVNGYLFIVDGNALVPELSQFVVATKVANHTTPNANVDNVFVTEVLTTNGDKMNVEVAATINSWGHHNWNDWFTHTGDIAGITKCPYCDDCGKPVVGSLYYIQPNDEGTYYLAAVPCFSTATNWTSIFDFGQAYIDGATLNSAGRWHHITGPMNNHGLNNMILDTAAGVAFKNYFNPADSFVVEDEAPIFVYNRNLNTYSVVKGSDLDAKNISGWAFTGATFKSPVITSEKRIATVDLGYVMVENNPVEKTILAYVDGDAIRTVNEDGKYVISVDVITADGVKTLTTDASVLQNNLKFQRLYNALKDGGIFELIVDGDTLVDVKWNAEQLNITKDATVTAAAETNGKLQLTIGGTTYFVTEDTTYIAVSADAPETAMGIVPGNVISFAADGNELTSIIF